MSTAPPLSTRLTLAFAVAAFPVPVIWGVAAVVNAPTTRVAAVVLPVWVGIMLFAWRWWRRSGVAAEQAELEYEAIVRRIRAIPADEARRQAEALLGDSSCFSVEPASTSLVRDHPLPAAVRELLARYESVEAVSNRIRIARNEVATVHGVEGLTRIGSDGEHTDIVADYRTGEMRFFSLEGAAGEVFPSIHHLVLYAVEVAAGGE